MAIANKTRWTELWAGIDGEVQTAKYHVTEDSNYNEITFITLAPIRTIKKSDRITPPKPEVIVTRNWKNASDWVAEWDRNREQGGF